MQKGASVTDTATGVPPLERPLPVPTPLQAFWGRFGPTLITVINLSIFVNMWQIVQGSSDPLVNTRWIPAPLDIVDAIILNIKNGELIKHASFSGTNYLIGMAIAIVAGIILGILLGLNPIVRSVSQAYTWVGFCTPTVALLPILIILFGLGVISKIFLVVLMGFFPIMINVLNGVATIDPVLMKAARLFGANRGQLFRKITLPYILPWIMIGIRIAAERSLGGVIIAEIFGSSRGLAYMIAQETDKFNSAGSYTAIAALMAFSLIVLYGVDRVEQKTLSWREASKY
ncbi:MAG: hypothetical protein A2Z14_04215 [Chloroflexi bacterium RBG_16_48_8]|nr:MAG: hypothetical protein A2Z14_04215 [Chloroflexi bacterium RBG_16_48_8]